jgi:hypothetical protein
MYTSSNQYTIGPYTSIVQTLSGYKVVPVGFLAEKLGVPTEETRDLLASLEKEGVVRWEGDCVGLTRRDKESVGAAH